jgi:hypothetical protein
MANGKQASIDRENLKLLYGLAGNSVYNPPSYTSIKEFSNNFPTKSVAEFVETPAVPVSEWLPELPYPRIYTKSYKKTIVTQI